MKFSYQNIKNIIIFMIITVGIISIFGMSVMAEENVGDSFGEHSVSNNQKTPGIEPSNNQKTPGIEPSNNQKTPGIEPS